MRTARQQRPPPAFLDVGPVDVAVMHRCDSVFKCMAEPDEA
jgi:hypothetical protein